MPVGIFNIMGENSHIQFQWVFFSFGKYKAKLGKFDIYTSQIEKKPGSQCQCLLFSFFLNRLQSEIIKVWKGGLIKDYWKVICIDRHFHWQIYKEGLI